MSEATAVSASRWSVFATSAYFLALLVVLDPGLSFLFAAWPPNPSLLPWRHISSGLLIVEAPMIGAAAVGILLVAKVRRHMRILKLLRLCGFGALVLGVPFFVLYAVDSATIYQNLPAAQGRSFVVLETRVFMMMAIGLALLWVITRATELRGD